MVSTEVIKIQARYYQSSPWALNSCWLCPGWDTRTTTAGDTDRGVRAGVEDEVKAKRGDGGGEVVAGPVSSCCFRLVQTQADTDPGAVTLKWYL